MDLLCANSPVLDGTFNECLRLEADPMMGRKVLAPTRIVNKCWSQRQRFSFPAGSCIPTRMYGEWSFTILLRRGSPSTKDSSRVLRSDRLAECEFVFWTQGCETAGLCLCFYHNPSFRCQIESRCATGVSEAQCQYASAGGDKSY